MRPRKVGEQYANACGCMQPHALAYISLLFCGAGPRKGMTQSMPLHGVACNPTHWHNTSPYVFWATCPRNVGEQPRALAYLFPLLCWATWPRTSIGQRMPLHKAACSPRDWHTFSPRFWATWPRQVGEIMPMQWAA